MLGTYPDWFHESRDDTHRVIRKWTDNFLEPGGPRGGVVIEKCHYFSTRVGNPNIAGAANSGGPGFNQCNSE
jgi:hypothetical protein